MKVLKERLPCISNNKFTWEYHNLDTGEKGTVCLMSRKEYDEIVSIDNDVNKYLSSGTICFKEISNNTKRQTKGKINYDYIKRKRNRII